MSQPTDDDEIRILALRTFQQVMEAALDATPSHKLPKHRSKVRRLGELLKKGHRLYVQDAPASEQQALTPEVERTVEWIASRQGDINRLIKKQRAKTQNPQMAMNMSVFQTRLDGFVEPLAEILSGGTPTAADLETLRVAIREIYLAGQGVRIFRVPLPPREPDAKQDIDQVHSLMLAEAESRRRETMAHSHVSPPAYTAPEQAKAKGGRSWKVVRGELVKMAEQNKPFTTYRDLKQRCNCGLATLKKAIHDSDYLKAWAGIDQPAEAIAQPKAYGFSEADKGGKAQSREAAPAHEIDDEEIMARLIEQAPADQREATKAAVENMTPEKLHDWAEWAANQPADADQTPYRRA